MSKIKACRLLLVAVLLLWQSIAMTLPFRHAMADAERVAAIGTSVGLDAAALSDGSQPVELGAALPAPPHGEAEHDVAPAGLHRLRLDPAAPAAAACVTTRLQHRHLEAPRRPPRHIV